MDKAMTLQSRLAPATDRKGLSGPALRTFLRIAESWELSVDEQMIREHPVKAAFHSA